MAKQEKIQAGDTAYLKDGREVMVEMVNGSQCAVQYAYTSENLEGGFQTDYAGSGIYALSDLYPEPPVAVYDESIKKIKAELRAAKDELSATVKESRTIEAECRERTKKFSNNVALKRIQDFIDGEIGYAVIAQYGPMEIVELSEALKSEDRDDHKLKLISLFGDSQGDFSWGINTYRDGSGVYRRIYPFNTYGEAKIFVFEWSTAVIGEYFNDKSPNDNQEMMRAVRSLQGLGLQVPKEALTLITGREIENADAAIEKAEKSLADLKAKRSQIASTD